MNCYSQPAEPGAELPSSDQGFLQFSGSVMSNSLRPRGAQHTRLLCLGEWWGFVSRRQISLHAHAYP